MNITYDPEVDAMYIKLVEGKHECRTVRLTEEIALDFGEGETLVGVEILDAKDVLGKGKLPRLTVNNLPFEWPRFRAARPSSPANGRTKVSATKVSRRQRKAG